MSGWLDSYYSITFNARGQKLYGDDLPRIIFNEISGQIDLTSEAYKISFATSSINISSNILLVAKEIAYAKAQIDAATVVLTSALEILKPNSLIQITSNLNVIASKDAFANANISINSNVLINAQEILFTGSSIAVSTQVATNAIEILFAQSDINANSNATVNVLKNALAKISINIVGYKLTIGQEILLSKIVINVDSNAIINTKKTAFAKCSISSNVNLISKAYEILIANINEISGDCNSSTKAIEILFAKVALSGLVVKVTVGKEILLGKLFLVGRVTQRGIPAIRFSPSITEDLQSIRPLLAIDNKPLTEHNRRISVSLNQSFIQNTNWASKKSRYYKKSSARKIFSIEWTQLPNSRDMTVDEKEGRDFISKIGSDARVHTLKVRNIDSDGIDPYTESEYNVIIKNYNESLIRRDLVDQTYYWNCRLELEEV
jgi:hypothetical protein